MKIIWYCAADSSWGGCDEEDLIVIPVAAFTPAELALLDDAAGEGDDDAVFDVIEKAMERND